MKFRYPAILLATAALTYSPNVASAATVSLLNDPLHIECTGCIDNGTNTPLPLPSSQFGFASSPPGETGNLFLDLLVPNTINTGTFVQPNISGFASGTPALFSNISWTSGTLAAYLGGAFTGGSPDNGIGAFLPSTQGQPGEAGATGFFDFTFPAGPVTLNGPGGVLTDPFQLSKDLPLGSYVIAMLVMSDGTVVNTANSGAGFINTQDVTTTPIMGTIGLFVSGLVFFGFLARRKAKRSAPSTALPA